MAPFLFRPLPGLVPLLPRLFRCRPLETPRAGVLLPFSTLRSFLRRWSPFSLLLFRTPSPSSFVATANLPLRLLLSPLVGISVFPPFWPRSVGVGDLLFLPASSTFAPLTLHPGPPVEDSFRCSSPTSLPNPPPLFYFFLEPSTLSSRGSPLSCSWFSLSGLPGVLFSRSRFSGKRVRGGLGPRTALAWWDLPAVGRLHLPSAILLIFFSCFLPQGVSSLI